MRDLRNQVFGKLTAIRKTGERCSNHLVWECRCECGATVTRSSSELSRTRSRQSCGCIRKGLKCPFKSTYNSWRSARARCFSRRNSRYHLYGGRGIAMCERWRESFVAFLSDMGARPVGTTLDRINNDGNYEPGNCRWATLKEQARNKTTSKFLTLNGVTKTVAEWTESGGLGSTTIRDRMATGWTLEDAILRPLRKALGGQS